MGVPASFLPPPAPRRGGAWGSQPVLAGKAEPRGYVVSRLPFRASGRWGLGSPPHHHHQVTLTLSNPCNQDQFEVLERHTQWGLDLLDKYVKFVKERAEVEQAYAKQLR